MAALYLHNAHVPDPPNSYGPTSSPHDRNISTLSGVTLYTGISEYSYPTEPLLHAETSESAGYRDMPSQQPAFVDTRRPAAFSVDGGPSLPQQKTSLWNWHVRRRYNWLKLIKGSLEILLGVWAVYTTVRYFLAFTLYNSADGQATSLALGISTGVSFALLMCAHVLTIFQPYLLRHRVLLRTLLFTRTGFDAFSLFFLLTPAVYNLVMTFIWRNSTSPDLNFRHRCHLDIDVVWSISKAQCNHWAWGSWLALSIVRLVVTLLIIITHCMISYRIGRPTPAPHRYHYRHRSQMSESQSSIPPSFAVYLPSYGSPDRLQHHSSDSTLSSHANSKHSSSQRSPRALRPHASMSTLHSEQDTALEAEVHEHDAHLPEDQEFNSFADRFRTLVSQITRETETGIQLARPDSVSDDKNSNFYMPPIPPALGYDEFGRPYPPEEQVSFLNGYIRRMPTIESMGSREAGSTTTSKGMTTSRRSTGNFSQPPTRSNTRAMSECSTGSQVATGAASSSVHGEISTGLGRTNEMGELVDRIDSGSHDASRTESSAATSGHTTSTSTMSYYTATSAASAFLSASEDVQAGGHLPGS